MVSNVIAKLSDHSQRICDAIALQWFDDFGKLDAQRTYGELRTRVESIAEALTGPAAGLRPGDRVLLSYGPGLDFIEAFLACLATGIVAVPVYPPTTGSLLRRYSAIAHDSDAALTLTTVEQLRTITRSLRGSLDQDDTQSLHRADRALAAAWLTTDDLTPREAHSARTPALSADAPAFLQYTSGTTGNPKGVVVTHRNLNHNLDAISRSVLTGYERDLDDIVCVSWLPHNHDMGLIGSRLATLFLGGRSVTFSPTAFLRDPGLWMEVCAREGATHTQAPDFALELCARVWSEERSRTLQGDLSSMVSLIVAAEPVRPATLRTFLDTFESLGLAPRALCPTYGLAEHTLFVSSAQGQADEAWTVHAGRTGNGAVLPQNDIDLRIVGENGVECVPGEIGEIWLDSPSKASGYWNQPDATEALFNAKLLSDSDTGYLRTGDLGFVNERGELFVTGRIKEMLIVRGANMHPHDLEETIRLALDGRIERESIVAFGVDNGHAEELVILLVSDTTDTHAELARDAVRAVASNHGVVPLEVLVAGHGSIPRTTSGKVQRHRLAERYTGGTINAAYSYQPRSAGHTGARSDEALTDTETRLRSVWSSVLGCSPESISRSSQFDQLGGDSVRTVQLAARIRSEFSLDASIITERRLFRCPALWDMARVIDEKRPEAAQLMDEDECQRERALAVAFLSQIGVTELSLDGKPTRAGATTGRCVLVTGATGFFGSYLVSSVLRATPDASIICLVRQKDSSSGMERIRKAMHSYGLWSQEYTHRMTAVEGDLGSPYLGLDQGDWRDLAERVDEIFHCAADVDWVRPYEQLKNANVRGTQEVIRLAAYGDALKPLHLMSTLGIHSEQYMLERVVAQESDEPRPIDFETDYFASKWIADSLAREAADRGMPIVIYRFDELTGDTTDGRLNLKGICARLIQGVTDLGAVPDIDVNYKLLPVDIVARSVLDISAKARADHSVYGKAFHLLAWNFTTLPRLWEMLREIGFELDAIPFASWCDRLSAATPDNALYPLLPYVRQIHIDRWLAAKANGTRFGIENVISVLDSDELDNSVQASTETALWMTIDYLLTDGSLQPPSRTVSKHLTVASGHVVSDQELADAVSSAFLARWPEQWRAPHLDLDIARRRNGSGDATTAVSIGASDTAFTLNAHADVVEHDGFYEIRVAYPEVLDPCRPGTLRQQDRTGDESDAETTAMPFDWVFHDGSDTAREDVESVVPPRVIDGLSAVADTAAITIDDILIGAFAVLLGRCDWQSEHHSFAAVSIGATTTGTATESLRGALTTSMQDGTSRRVSTGIDHSASFLDFARSVIDPAPLGQAPDTIEVIVRRQVAAASGTDGWQIIDRSEPPAHDRALTVDIDLQADEWSLRWTFDASRIDRGSIVRLAEGFEALLSAVADDPGARIGRLPVMRPEARNQVLFEFNASASESAAAVAATKCLHELVVDQARRTPDRVAVVTEESSLTFEQLVNGAAAVADELAKLGVAVEDRVAVLIGRSNEAAVGLLAASLAGAAYVPLDPDIPVSRLAFMARDAGCRAVLVVEDTAEILESREWDVDLPVIHLDRVLARGPVPMSDHRPVAVAPSNALYVLYTSGSTGEPKGVVVEHRNVVNMLQDSSFHELAVDSYGRWLQSCSLGFCLHVLMWHPLTTGGSVRMVRSLADHIPNDVDAVSISLSALEAIDLPDSVKAVYIAGEKRTARAVEQVGSRRLYDAYGATETIVGVGGFVESPFDDHVGGPLANTQAYVLDGFGNPVPIGVRGEIYLAGTGIARGYVNRPELSAERFSDNPFEPGRMYRTGDLGCWLPSGRLRVFGRIDDQVKVHGCRVELKEIQAAIHDGDEGVVSAHAAVSAGNLVAWVTPADVDTRAVQQRIRATKPRYMVPDRITAVDAFPALPSGKVDTAQLLTVLAGGRQTATPPRTAMEAYVVSVWREVMGIEVIGRDDDFFDLGGNSLLGIRVQRALQEVLGIDVLLQDIFESRSPEALGKRLDHAQGEVRVPPLLHLEPADPLLPRPVSPIQEALWFLEQQSPGLTLYPLPLAVRFEYPVDPALFTAALREVIQRHEALRTVFVEDDDGFPTQLVRTVDQALDHRVEEWTELSLDDFYRATQSWFAEPFDLGRDAFRSKLVRRSDTEWYWLINVHHMSADGESLAQVAGELAVLYRGGELTPQLLQYSDYAVWQRALLNDPAVGNASVEWWEQTLQGAPFDANLPTDRPRPARRTYASAAFETYVPADISAGVKKFAQRRAVTEFAVLISAFGIMQGRFAGEDSALVGTAVADRRRRELDTMVGMCLNGLPVRVDLPSEHPFAEVVLDTHEMIIGLLDHRNVPLADLVERMGVRREPNKPPVFQTMMVLEDFAPEALPHLKLADDCPTPELNSAAIGGLAYGFDVLVLVIPEGDRYRCVWEYSTELFDHDSVLRLAAGFEALLGGVVDNPGAVIGDLPVMTPESREQVLYEFNGHTSEPAAAVAATPAFEGPATDIEVYVLDGFGNPVPINVRGEIYLGGAGIARSSVNQPELPAERFSDNPFGAGRMYRTGDLGCWLPSGRLQVFGRIEDQVKVHGSRVELNEVQAAILDGDEGVVSAHVAVSAGNLVAWVTPASVNTRPVQRRLRASKPRYMVPDRLTAVDAFPVLPSGEVDIAQLLTASSVTRSELSKQRPPATANAGRLTAIWTEVLACPEVGMDDDFFDLGGNSLSAVRAAVLARRAGLSLTVVDIMQAPTFADQLAHLEGGTGAGAVVTMKEHTGSSGSAVLVTGIGGTLIPLRPIADALPISVYGIQYADAVPDSSIADMADYLLSLSPMRETAPSILVGYSFGGVVAWEIVNQLRTLGRKVEHLVLIEPMITPDRREAAAVAAYLQQHDPRLLAAELREMTTVDEHTLAALVSKSAAAAAGDTVPGTGLAASISSALHALEPVRRVDSDGTAMARALNHTRMALEYHWPTLGSDCATRIHVIAGDAGHYDLAAVVQGIEALASPEAVRSQAYSGTHDSVLQDPRLVRLLAELSAGSLDD